MIKLIAKPRLASVSFKAASNRVEMLQREIVKAKSEAKRLKRAVKVVNMVREQFDALPQVRLHRSHGWITTLERLQVYYFAKGGIRVEEVAAKFSISGPTVYKYLKSGGF